MFPDHRRRQVLRSLPDDPGGGAGGSLTTGWTAHSVVSSGRRHPDASVRSSASINREPQRMSTGRRDWPRRVIGAPRNAPSRDGSTWRFNPRCPPRAATHPPHGRNRAPLEDASTHAALRGRRTNLSMYSRFTYLAFQPTPLSAGGDTLALQREMFEWQKFQPTPPFAGGDTTAEGTTSAVVTAFQPTPPSAGGDTGRTGRTWWRATTFQPTPPSAGGDTPVNPETARGYSAFQPTPLSGRRHADRCRRARAATGFQPTPPSAGGDTRADERRLQRVPRRFNPRRPQRAATPSVLSRSRFAASMFQPTPPSAGGDTWPHMKGLIASAPFQPTPPSAGGDTWSCTRRRARWRMRFNPRRPQRAATLVEPLAENRRVLRVSTVTSRPATCSRFQPTPPSAGGDTSSRRRPSSRTGSFNPRRPQRAATRAVVDNRFQIRASFQPTPMCSRVRRLVRS